MASASAFSAAIILASNHKCDDSPTAAEAAAAAAQAAATIPAGVPSPPQSTTSSPLTSPELLRFLASVGQQVPSPPSQHPNDASAALQHSNHDSGASQASLISPALLRLFGMTPPPADARIAPSPSPSPPQASSEAFAADSSVVPTAVVPSSEAFLAGDGSSRSAAAVDRLFSNLRHSLADEMTHTTRAVEPKVAAEQKQSPNLGTGHRRTVLDGSAAGVPEGEPTDETESDAEFQSSPAILKSAAAPAPTRGASTSAGANDTTNAAAPESATAPQACCALQ